MKLRLDIVEAGHRLRAKTLTAEALTEACLANITARNGELKAFIRKNELSRDRAEQRPDRYAVGDKIDVRVTNVDKAARKIALSIKAREIAEEKDAVAQYGSSDSGASLGDILGAALRKKAEKADE